MKIKHLAEFWKVPVKTLYSRKKSNIRQFKAFMLGTECIQKGITQEDLEWIEEVKKECNTKGKQDERS